MAIKVSIIIPAYNVEKYIAKCLDSVCNQTLKEIEIIVLNDGSTDNTGRIIEEYKEKDSRIIYIYHENIGVGATRNKGVDIAQGEYIGFVDPDDTVNLDMFEKMYIAAKQYEADVISCNINFVEGNVVRRDTKRLLTIVNDVSSNMNEFLKKYYYGLYMYRNCVWDKIFKRGIIQVNNVKFGDLSLITCEDLYFGINVLQYTDTVVFLEDYLYNYTIREDSLINIYNNMVTTKTINFIKEMMREDCNDRYKAFISTYVYSACIIISKHLINNKKIKELYNDIDMLVNDKTIIECSLNILKDKKNNIHLSWIKRMFLNLVARCIIKKRKRILFIVLIIKEYL